MGVAMLTLSGPQGRKLKKMLNDAPNRVERAKIEAKISTIVRRAITDSSDAGLLGQIGDEIRDKILP